MPQIRNLCQGDVQALWNITDHTLNDLDHINLRNPWPEQWLTPYQ